MSYDALSAAASRREQCCQRPVLLLNDDVWLVPRRSAVWVPRIFVLFSHGFAGARADQKSPVRNLSNLSSTTLGGECVCDDSPLVLAEFVSVRLDPRHIAASVGCRSSCLLLLLPRQRRPCEHQRGLGHHLHRAAHRPAFIT